MSMREALIEAQVGMPVLVCAECHNAYHLVEDPFRYLVCTSPTCEYFAIKYAPPGQLDLNRVFYGEKR